MIRYTFKRVAYMVINLLIIIILTFYVMHSIPGNPFSTEKNSPVIVARLMEKYGMNEPLHVQLGQYFQNLAHLDLGVSMKSPARDVNEIIKEHFPVSAELGMWSLLFATLLGLVLGIISALRRNKPADRFAMVISVIGMSVPGFILATLMQLFFGVVWMRQFGKPLFEPTGWGSVNNIILPAVSLGTGTLALYTRMMRTSMLDVLGQDYIKTAKAKGISGFEVVWRHAVRNAMLPIVTMLGATIINLTTGSIIIETIFAIPGLGRYFVDSIFQQDYTVIMGTTVFYGALLVVAYFVVDIAYGWVDPRIRLAGGKR